MGNLRKDPGYWAHIISTLTKGQFVYSQRLVPHLHASGSCWIFNSFQRQPLFLRHGFRLQSYLLHRFLRWRSCFLNIQHHESIIHAWLTVTPPDYSPVRALLKYARCHYHKGRSQCYLYTWASARLDSADCKRTVSISAASSAPLISWSTARVSSVRLKNWICVCVFLKILHLLFFHRILENHMLTF